MTVPFRNASCVVVVEYRYDERAFRATSIVASEALESIGFR